MVGIGAQMFFSAFNHEIKKIVQPVGVGLLILAFTVSIDSFSVGLSLGISGVKTAITLLMFGAVSMMLTRSEEHTSELQSRGHLVCRLLLEKKKTEHEGLKEIQYNSSEMWLVKLNGSKLS